MAHSLMLIGLLLDDVARCDQLYIGLLYLHIYTLGYFTYVIITSYITTTFVIIISLLFGGLVV